MQERNPEPGTPEEREQVVDRELVDAVTAALAAGDAARVRALAGGLDAPDLADLIELLSPEIRAPLIETLGANFDAEALSEVDAGVRDQLAEELPNEVIAEAIEKLDADDAAYVIEPLDAQDRQEVLERLPEPERAALERNLEYPPETAGRLMQPGFIAVPPFRSVGWLIDYMRETRELPDRFSEVFVVDPKLHVLGSVPLDRILRSRREVLLRDIMDTERHVVLATEDQEEVARQFERHDLMSAPVVDEDQRLVGVVTVDDVVEVIEEEAEEDLRLLAGVGQAGVSDSVRDTVRSRLPWLAVNILTALLASAVIKTFDATIEQMVALAVLMPVVASMGGNAGSQTMTVAVRALATRDLSSANAARVIGREAAVGLVNGFVFACLMALVAFVWFGSGKLGGVIAAAMICNLLAAALAGILIPLGLHKLKFDPAVASSVFVTTVTDVVGFFSFLGLASLVMLR